MKTMKTNNLFSVLSAMTLLTACGSNATRDYTSQGYSSNSTSSGSQNIYNLPAAPQFDAKISGWNGGYPSLNKVVPTNATLKVKVQAQPPIHMMTPGYENVVAMYTCVSYIVHVNGVDQSTGNLAVPGATQASDSPCKNSPDHVVLDFHNALTGAGAVNVVMDSAQYNHLTVSNTFALSGPSMTPVWRDHMTEALVTIQIDNTWMDE